MFRHEGTAPNQQVAPVRMAWVALGTLVDNLSAGHDINRFRQIEGLIRSEPPVPNAPSGKEPDAGAYTQSRKEEK